jgi:hypothetical protein
VFLQYLLGLQRLGWDVVFVDRLEPAMCIDGSGSPAELTSSINVRYLAGVMDRFGLGDCWSLLFDRGREVVGVPRAELLDRVRRSAFILNVNGFLEDEVLLGAAQRRVFLDIDPGVGQMWHALGQADLFKGHDDYITIGENIGRQGCAIPTLGMKWITTKQPVVLEHWVVVPTATDRFTSVATWRGTAAPISYEGRVYGMRVHEFRRFLELPARSNATFELALDIHEAERDDLRRLKMHGWTLADPAIVAGDPWRYRDYIARSKAELMVAKNMPVQANMGWFSDRSACYLASGRPVLAQDTGLESLLPIGEGLITFTTLEEAVAGVDAIVGDYDRHARAAREVAAEHFDSDVVLSHLLAQLGVG